eukprot:scaffold5517_cov135-Cylindrotheca_fusiformis.AAC.36
MIDSPIGSSNESDDGDDIFRFQKRKFVRNSNVDKCYDTPSISTRRKRVKQPSTDDQVSVLERKKKARSKRVDKSLTQCSSLSNSDDDAVEVVYHVKDCARANNGISSPIEVMDSAFVPKKERQSVSVDMLDSSDDESPRTRVSSVRLATLTGASRESMDVLQRSKQATLQLKRAQYYHAEDIQVDAHQLEESSACFVGVARGVAATSNQNQSIDFSNLIGLNCRIQIDIGGRKKSTQRTFTLKENEVFQVLVHKILSTLGIPTGFPVSITFKGIVLDLRRTPSFYDIRDGDMIEVQGNGNVNSLCDPGSKKQISLGPKIVIRLRRKVEKKMEEVSLNVGQSESFERIIDSYKKKQALSNAKVTLRFDGETLKTSGTPSAYDIESGDLIDVVCEFI